MLSIRKNGGVQVSLGKEDGHGGRLQFWEPTDIMAKEKDLKGESV